jgi:hypothetical protein
MTSWDASLLAERAFLYGVVTRISTETNTHSLFYRYRVPHFAAKGIKVKTEQGHLVERIDELPKIGEWVQTYSDLLRTAGHS